ncbi:MAG: hypothetical protein FWC16_00155 [Defluviitaleaceae bacterium]|nr:hypothetical protein [Defluviitaleaceae bacterium]MCL2273314.1 hypothetical protein [Defluviitaleaceae bacterium]
MARLVALLLVLCLAAPVTLSAMAGYIKATHTHVCHDKTHSDDCAGKEDCCAICISLLIAEFRPIGSSDIMPLLTCCAAIFYACASCLYCVHILRATLCALHIRLNH